MKVKVFVGVKKTILDPQGKTVRQALQTLGYTEVKDVRIGKFIELELSPRPGLDVGDQVKGMCEKLLANPIIEDYQYEICKES